MMRVADALDKLFAAMGLGGVPGWAHWSILVAVILAIAWGANWVARRVILRGIRRVARRTATAWDDALIEHHVFDRLSHLAPVVVLYFSSELLVPGDELSTLRGLLQRLLIAWTVLVGLRVCNALLDVLEEAYSKRPAHQNRPIRSYVQVVKIVVAMAAGILAVATLLGKSPWALLGGLGAATAILLLVFRDSILGFIASVQIASYDLVRVGEWIEVPKYGVDGDVIEVNLHTIKVQNWDKTIVTFPTVALLTDGFKNWRGMTLSGGRRIKRALHLDITSVRFLTKDEIEHLRGVDLLRPYLDRKLAEIEEWNAGLSPSDFLRKRRLTNVGTFRAYVEALLESHPHIHHEMTTLVRQLAPAPDGLPIELYVFSREQAWKVYEGILSDIFDHLIAIVAMFGLRVFQNPSGEQLSDAIRALAGAEDNIALPIGAADR